MVEILSGAKRQPQKEHVIRDRLAVSLGLIEAGLTLIKVEYALPNLDGASGSVDILARDRSGNYVIIELKRSDQTARQALHELNKYVSLMASHAGVRADQLRCILLSTTWHELRVPFARFAADASFHSLALQLEVDDSGYPTGVSAVELPEVAPGLEACPKHIDILYHIREVRDTAIQNTRDALVELDVIDYFILVMDYQGPPELIMHPFGLYVVFAEFSEERRAATAAAYFAEVGEPFDSDEWGEEELEQSHLVGMLQWDTVEIGTPDRFKSTEDSWSIERTVRGGAYAAALWSDDDLIGLAASRGGKYSAAFERQVQVANRPAWTRMLSDVQYSLMGADPWPELVDTVLTEIALRPNAEVKVNVYSPCDLVWGLTHLVKSRGDSAYLPQIAIAVRDGDDSRFYHGCLLWDGQRKPQDLNSVFGDLTGDLFGYFVARTSGGAWDIDAELCLRHGLRYQIHEFLPSPDDRVFRLAVKNGKIKRTEHSEDDGEIAPWSEFIAANKDYLSTLARAVDSMVMGPGESL